YMIYWRAVAPRDYPKVVTELEAEEKQRLSLDRRTLDRVTPGEQQPEVEHKVQGEGATTGVTNGRSWRDASGWFGYELRVPASTASVSGTSLALLVTYPMVNANAGSTSS